MAAAAKPQAQVAALAVSSEASDRSLLRKIFHEADWRLIEAATCQDAIQSLQTEPVRVVIADRDLPDGGWMELLSALQRRRHPPALVVTARLADESLWSEVLNMGGFDVLAQPFNAEEVTRVIGAALRHFQNAFEPLKPLTMTA